LVSFSCHNGKRDWGVKNAAWPAGTRRSPSASSNGDINGDGRVNSLDYFQFSSAFGSRSTDARYRGLFDYNHDGRINSVDYFQFSTNFGQFLFLPA
jgi:hypothetical protein